MNFKNFYRDNKDFIPDWDFSYQCLGHLGKIHPLQEKRILLWFFKSEGKTKKECYQSLAKLTKAEAEQAAKDILKARIENKDRACESYG